MGVMGLNKFKLTNIFKFLNNSKKDKQSLDLEVNKEKQISELKAVYKLAIETRNFEIQQLINRNNFFMLFQGVLLAALLSNQAPKPFVEFIICAAGVLVSWHQIKVAAGAKYWQEWWELRTSEIESDLKELLTEEDKNNKDFISLFDLKGEEKENQKKKVRDKLASKGGIIEGLGNLLILKKYSVSRVPIWTGLTLMCTWFVAFLSTIDFSSILTVFESVDIIKGITFMDIPKPDPTTN